MNRIERITAARKLYEQLKVVQGQLSGWDSAAPEAARTRPDLPAARAQMAALEHQISLLRLLQSENRLRQQLWIAIPSLFTGAAATLALQYLKTT